MLFGTTQLANIGLNYKTGETDMTKNAPIKKLSQDQIVLENWQDLINKNLFNNELDPCTISIQTRGKMNAFAWCTGSKVWKNGKLEIREINFSAEYLNRPIKDMFETMIHELVHAYNSQNKIKDCSSNQYHNKNFKNKCETVGLTVEKTKFGWSETSITPNGIADKLFKKQKISKTVFNYARKELAKKPAKEGKLKKYSCNCSPAKNIRWGRSEDPNILCRDCDSMFHRVA